MNYLKSQELHQLYNPKRRTNKIKPTILDKPLKQLGVDLIDLQTHETDNYNYILTCIDLFSKKAYAQPLKNKTDKATAQAMEKIINQINNKIHSIRSDNGSEFISKEFKNLLKEHNIKQVLSLPYTPQSNGGIERFNYTIKKLILTCIKYDDNFNWPNELQRLINNYNNTISTTTKHKPDKVETMNPDELSKVRNNIIKKVSSKNSRDTQKFNKLDKVRIKITDERDKTGWSKEIYTIKSVNIPKNGISNLYYRLNKIKGNYYNNDLLKVDKIENEIKEIKKYEISKIIKKVVKKGKKYYVVKWKGYKETTEEPRDVLIQDVPKMIKHFERDNPKE
jgi:hypothetical protein